MKKKLNIFGRKVPVLAVMMVLLVIGTASAALIDHYATLSGDFTVSPTIAVDGNNGEDLVTINFDETTGVGTFTITNSGTGPEGINLDTTLYYNMPFDTLPENMVNFKLIDTEGTTITYETSTSGLLTALDVDGGVYDGNYVSVPLTAEVTTTTVTVTFGADHALETGKYTIQVKVNPVP